MKETIVSDLTLVDGNGHRRASLSVTNGEPSLRLYGHDGAARVTVGIMSESGVETAALCLHDAAGRVKASLGVGPLGGERIIGADGLPSKVSVAEVESGGRQSASIRPGCRDT